MRLLPALFTLILLLSSHVASQCTVNAVDFRSYGRGCTTTSNFTPSLTGQFDSVTCNVSLRLAAFGGCCGTNMRNRLFLLGARQAQTPAAWMGSASCFLFVDPLIIVAVPPSQTTLTANLPRNTRLGTAYLQGVAAYVTTATNSASFEVSNALALTLR